MRARRGRTPGGVSTFTRGRLSGVGGVHPAQALKMFGYGPSGLPLGPLSFGMWLIVFAPDGR